MIRRTLPFLGLFLFLGFPLSAQRLPTATPESLGLSSERLERIGEVFQGYVDEGRIAGAVGMVLRDGKVAYVDEWGMRDIDTADPLEDDDIFRIFSMSKPITSVAIMMLWEEGHFFLTDPVGRYIPELRNLQVAKLAEATSENIPTERARRQITIQDLLRHTSGLTYGLFSNTPVDRRYREAGILSETTLAEFVENLSEIPLLYQPGSRWNYSVSTDVLGRLVEVVSGQPFDQFLEERVFKPLGMKDTGFHVAESELGRFSRTYRQAGRSGPLVVGDTVRFTRPATFLSGGGGLVSTADDYSRFAQMLLNGGEFEGTRILGRKTVDLMTTDQLGDALYGRRAAGWGWGLGFNVKTVAGLDGMPGSVGNYYWWGVQGTSFWIDPTENLIGIFMVQITAPGEIAFREQFKRLVYQALVG
jgi:CubicO group peptidase (beta-lactamase class C family)